MRKLKFFLTISLIFGLTPLSQVWAQGNVKLAQSGMQFLSVVSDARASALGGAVTTMHMQSASLFFNPATMAESNGVFDFSVSYNEWIADIKHFTSSLSYRPMNGDIGVFGLSVQSVDYGDILGTSVDNSSTAGYVDNGLVKASGLAVGFGYAKAISDAFSIGGQVRWINHNLGESLIPLAGGGVNKINNVATTQAFDFGTIFKPGFKSFAFGMSVRNFSKEIHYNEGQDFELPLTFTMGISMDIMDLIDKNGVIRSFYVSINAVHNRDYYEQIYIGGECDMLDILKLRIGYISNSDEMGVSFGFGVHKYGLAVDYAYTPFGIFSKVQRMTFSYSL
jgi:hypothetical protein